MATACSPVCQFLHQHHLKLLTYFNQIWQEKRVSKIITFPKVLWNALPRQRGDTPSEGREKGRRSQWFFRGAAASLGLGPHHGCAINWLWHRSDPSQDVLPPPCQQLHRSRAVTQQGAWWGCGRLSGSYCTVLGTRKGNCRDHSRKGSGKSKEELKVLLWCLVRDIGEEKRERG